MKRDVPRLVVVQPSLRQYRVRFLELLESQLRQRGVEFVVVHGDAIGDFARRGGATTAPWGAHVKTRSISAWSRSVEWRSTGRILRDLQPDYLVLPQGIRHLDNHVAVARGFLGGPRLAFFGHGGTYSDPQSRGQYRIKQWMTRRGEWFFAYTRRGADEVIRNGFDADRVTVLNNTVDTQELRRDLQDVSNDETGRFRQMHNLWPGSTGLFLGGTDENKGFSFLLDAARQVAASRPRFVLLVAGQGRSANLARDLEAAGGPVRYLGPQYGRGKALALAVSDFLTIPRAVGLVAADALVAGRPVVTTDCPWHGPEYDYLEAGRTAVITREEPSAYAEGVRFLVDDPRRLAAMQHSAAIAGRALSIESMVESFATGVDRWRITTAAARRSRLPFSTKARPQ